MQAKKAIESLTIMTELVLPNETNTLGNMMGGKLMYWMDICGGIAAQKHCNEQVVTASVDNISFAHPIKLGNILTIEAKITRAFNTSMEIYLTVHGEDLQTSEKHLTNEAYMTFVALNKETGKATAVPEVIAETMDELNRYAGALRRRQLRLILAGKMKPDDASELKALFVEEN